MLSDDVFQLLSLGLGLLVLVLLLLVWNGVNRVRKALESTAAPATTEGAWAAAAPQQDTAESWQAATPGPATSATESTSGALGTMATTGSETASVAASSQAAETAEPAVATAPEAAAGASEPAASSSATAAATTEAAPAAEEEPQEQPFERDGRWYFRRGEELLLYEEQTGQWVPAPQGSGAPGAAAAQPATAAVGGSVAAATQAQPGATGSFWKCPSCGAVNGSTAESCRMCFTPRP